MLHFNEGVFDEIKQKIEHRVSLHLREFLRSKK